jgi:hypothetical protein
MNVPPFSVEFNVGSLLSSSNLILRAMSWLSLVSI